MNAPAAAPAAVDKSLSLTSWPTAPPTTAPMAVPAIACSSFGASVTVTSSSQHSSAGGGGGAATVGAGRAAGRGAGRGVGWAVATRCGAGAAGAMAGAAAGGTAGATSTCAGAGAIIATSGSVAACLSSSAKPATPPAVATPMPAATPINIDRFMNDPPWFEPSLCRPVRGPVCDAGHTGGSACASVAFRRQQTLIFRKHDRLCTRLHAELLEDSRHVIADGFLADEELAADLNVREAGRDALKNLALARRQGAEHLGNCGSARERQDLFLEPCPGRLRFEQDVIARVELDERRTGNSPGQ